MVTLVDTHHRRLFWLISPIEIVCRSGVTSSAAGRVNPDVQKDAKALDNRRIDTRNVERDQMRQMVYSNKQQNILNREALRGDLPPNDNGRPVRLADRQLFQLPH
jgi:hypothetical protein